MKSVNEKIGKCIICGNTLAGEEIIFNNMPAGAQAMPTEDTLSIDKGITLRLTTCKECGLTQFDTEPVDYYKKAIRVVGLSNYMKELRRKDYELLDKEYGLSNKKVIEVGCGNGDFLLELEKYNSTINIFGTCEDDNNIKNAKNKLSSKATIIKFFTEKDTDIIPGAPFDYFLSFNFLEHQPFPVTMLKVIYNSLVDEGIGLISVPSFEYILNNKAYYELIRDHIANYDIDSLRYLFIKTGFEVVKAEYISIGDTIRFLVKKKSKNDNIQKNINSNILSIEPLKNSIEIINKRIEEIVNEHKASNKTIALWGAGHQGFTIASTTCLKDFAKYIIDSSSEKVGKYAPASHIKIVKPEYYYIDKVDTIFIVAPAYINEIKSKIKELFGDTVNVIDILSIER